MSSISSSVISVLHLLGGVVGVVGVKKRDSPPTLFKTFHRGQRQALANEDFVSLNVFSLLKIGLQKVTEIAVIRINIPRLTSKFVSSLEVGFAQFDKRPTRISADGNGFAEEMLTKWTCISRGRGVSAVKA